MNQRHLVVALFIFVWLSTIACGLTINWPIDTVDTGPTQVEDINIAMPESEDETVRLTISFGAGELRLNPGAEGMLVQGSATYNVEDLKPNITISGSAVEIETGNFEVNSLPNFKGDLENAWDLTLGKQPLDLRVFAGAYTGTYELGDLALKSLRISDGAAKTTLSFVKPNLIEMDTLRYETGASDVTLIGLANANFTSMIFKGGAGSYTLDFTGSLSRDADVAVDAGLSSLVIIVPRGVSARVFVDSGLGDVDVLGDWEKSGNEYTLLGGGPRLTININIGAGSLDLRNN